MKPLQDQLDEITASTRNLVQPERLAVSERAVADLYGSGIEEHILPVGAKAPDFALPDAAGHLLRRKDLLPLGPLVINFFRGRWCPYCVTELESWEDLYPAVRQRGGLLVGISPQLPRQNEFLILQHALSFPVLSDGGCRVAAEFGLAYEVPVPMRDYYRSILVNIPLVNGNENEGNENGTNESWRLPLPATYVLSPDGVVVFAEAHADFRVRPEPMEVLEALSTVSRSR